MREADSISLIVSWPQIGEVLLSGSVSGKAAIATRLGPRPVNTIIFQAPIRKGFSGAPVFSNATGHVVGIINTLVFGISSSLDQIRKTFIKGRSIGNVEVVGVDLGEANIALIDSLETNLIGGLGTAVDASYAQQIRAQTKDSLNYKKP